MEILGYMLLVSSEGLGSWDEMCACMFVNGFSGFGELGWYVDSA